MSRNADTPKWDEGKIRFLTDLWRRDGAAYLSTSNIADQCAAVFCHPVSKNAIVGKAHRLGLEARPSPIIRHEAPPAPCKPRPVACAHPDVVVTLPTLQSLLPTAPPPPVARSTRSQAALSYARPCDVAMPPKLKGPCRRRDGSGCYWPIGEPGSRDFRHCDGLLEDPSKSYCSEHSGHAYTKVRQKDLNRHDGV